MTYTFEGGNAACQIANLDELYERYIGDKTDGFFVEIGAFNGYNWSNTLPLISAGWSGIMVEADPENFSKLAMRHMSNPKLKLVQVAIAKDRGLAKLYQGGSTSTIYEPTVDIYHGIPPLACAGLSHDCFVMVPKYTMDDLFDFYNCPDHYDVLVIDVEGGEIDVLAGYDIASHRPTMAIIEAHEQSPFQALRKKARKINRYFKDNGYKKIQSDEINNVYVNR